MIAKNGTPVTIRTLYGPYYQDDGTKRVVATNIPGEIVGNDTDVNGKLFYIVRFERINRRQYSHFTPDELIMPNKPQKRAVIVGLYQYTGVHSKGKDQARKGDFKLARAARAYVEVNGNGPICSQCSPARARRKAENDGFGRAYFYRVTDIEAVLKWYHLYFFGTKGK